MVFNSMFAEVPTKKPYRDDPAGHHQVRDARHMCQIMKHLLSTAPQWTHRTHVSGTVGLPFNAMFDWPMGTPSGWDSLLDPTVNKHLKEILNDWGSYLQSSGSADVLGDDPKGWLGAEGKKELTRVANEPCATNHKFEEMFICQPDQKYHGFKKWDDLSTRLNREGIRPVAEPEDDNVLANACESKPYRVAEAVLAKDEFWVKGQPYSVRNTLA